MFEGAGNHIPSQVFDEITYPFWNIDVPISYNGCNYISLLLRECFSRYPYHFLCWRYSTMTLFILKHNKFNWSGAWQNWKQWVYLNPNVFPSWFCYILRFHVQLFIQSLVIGLYYFLQNAKFLTAKSARRTIRSPVKRVQRNTRDGNATKKVSFLTDHVMAQRTADCPQSTPVIYSSACIPLAIPDKDI